MNNSSNGLFYEYVAHTILKLYFKLKWNEQHFWKYPKDKGFLFQIKFCSNRIMKQRQTNNLLHKKVTIKKYIQEPVSEELS